ncbi:hypothetical protein FF2_006058 [Malus domestica]
MSLKQKFRPYSVLVVLWTSASPGFNDQVKIPAPENLTSGEFSVVLSVRRFMNVEDEVDYFYVLNAMQMNVYIADGCLFATGMKIGYDCWRHLFRGVLCSVFRKNSQTSSERMSLFIKIIN